MHYQTYLTGFTGIANRSARRGISWPSMARLIIPTALACHASLLDMAEHRGAL